MKNKKGFTLVELLAVIAILAIIVVIAYPMITNTIENSRQKAFELSEASLIKAAKNYASSGEFALPENIDDEVEISYDTLKNLNYVEEIVDPKNRNECVGTIIVKKVADSEYTYSSNLLCDNYVSAGATNPPVITLLGDNPQRIVAGYSYTELDATAIDNVDGDVSGDITIDTSSVDMTKIGTYSVTYNVSDSSGNTAQKTRQVIVYQDEPTYVYDEYPLVTTNNIVSYHANDLHAWNGTLNNFNYATNTGDGFYRVNSSSGDELAWEITSGDFTNLSANTTYSIGFNYKTSSIPCENFDMELTIFSFATGHNQIAPTITEIENGICSAVVNFTPAQSTSYRIPDINTFLDNENFDYIEMKDPFVIKEERTIKNNLLSFSPTNLHGWCGALNNFNYATNTGDGFYRTNVTSGGNSAVEILSDDTVSLTSGTTYRVGFYYKTSSINCTDLDFVFTMFDWDNMQHNPIEPFISDLGDGVCLASGLFTATHTGNHRYVDINGISSNTNFDYIEIKNPFVIEESLY